MATLTIRLNEEEKQELKKIADINNRTITGQIKFFIKENCIKTNDKSKRTNRTTTKHK